MCKINGLLERMGSRADPDIKKRKQEHLKVVEWVLISIACMYTAHSWKDYNFKMGLLTCHHYYGINNMLCYLYFILYRQERKVYHHHRSKSRSNPDKYACVIIDGMDQKKTRLSLTRKIAKSTQNLYHLRTHITGSLDKPWEKSLHLHWHSTVATWL